MPLHEREMIDRLRQKAERLGRLAQVGIGDDCAVLRLAAGEEALVTTDFNLEGVHFRREWHPADSVGHRCLARGLSDIAAMGGTPRAAFLSLAIPPELPQQWVDEFISGLLTLAQRYSVPLAGGDTAQSPGGVLADIMVVGGVPGGTAILRSKAKAGDLLYVTGTLGSAAETLDELEQGKKPRPRSRRKHFFPEPRLAVGQFLRDAGLASAMIDISDGLSTDLSHICEESGMGAVVHQEAVPVAAGLGERGMEFALHGGDEYELLFTARPQRRVPKQIAGVPVTQIGKIVRGRTMKIVRHDGFEAPLLPQGWEHFSEHRDGHRTI